jgi:predicted nucleic acid-binding Zn ribbon protein
VDALARAAINAQRQGMSYGQYMAMRFEQNGYKPMPKEEPIPEIVEAGEGFKVCVICGRPFLKNSRGSQAKTCSEKCGEEQGRKATRERYWKKRNEKPGRTAKCVICGKEFQTRLTRQVACSEECSNKRRLWREEQYEMRKMSK